MSRRVAMIASVGMLSALFQIAGLSAGYGATSGSTVVVSQTLPPTLSDPQVDNKHHRVFAVSRYRLYSFPYDLSTPHMVKLAQGDRDLGIPADNSAVYVLDVNQKASAAGSSSRLLRFDPVTLARTGSWAEPGVYRSSNLVFAAGLFWAVVQRTPPGASYERNVLATLDPHHPGEGWRSRGATALCFTGCYLVAAPQRHWLLVVDPGSSANIGTYRVWGDGTASHFPDTSVANFINGPSFSPDGASAVVNANYVTDPQTGYAPLGFALCRLPDLTQPTQQWSTPDGARTNVAYTPDGQWIAAVDGYGHATFFDPADSSTPPITGAHIPLTNTVQGVHAPSAYTATFPLDRPYFFTVVEEDIASSTGTAWTYHLARYPIP